MLATLRVNGLGEDLPLRLVTTDRVESVQAKMLASAARKTVNNRMLVVGGVLANAHDRGWIATNPTAKARVIGAQLRIQTSRCLSPPSRSPSWINPAVVMGELDQESQDEAPVIGEFWPDVAWQGGSPQRSASRADDRRCDLGAGRRRGAAADAGRLCAADYRAWGPTAWRRPRGTKHGYQVGYFGRERRPNQGYRDPYYGSLRYVVEALRYDTSTK